MSTLAIMKERIASELRRDDLSSASEFRVVAQVSDIHDAIMSAIEMYQHRRVYWSESRSLTFSTVQEQDLYDESDEEDIPRIIKFDYVTITVGGQPYELRPIPPLDAELTNGGSTSPGQPEFYCFYSEQIRLVPTPVQDDWIVRIGAVLTQAAPAGESEANNVWMTKAERLIRATAKMELYLHIIKDVEAAQAMKAVVDDQLKRIDERTISMTQMGDMNVEPWG